MLLYFLSYSPKIHEKIINMDINRASNNICHFISPRCVVSEIIISKEMLSFKRFLLENMAWVHSGTIANRQCGQKCEKWLHSIINYLICTHSKIMKYNIRRVNMFMIMNCIYVSYISYRKNVIASTKRFCGFCWANAY